MNNVIKRVWNQNRMVQIEDLQGMTFQAESAGHTFEISGIDDAGQAVTFSGTPAGVFLRPDNTDVALTCSVSGGKVYATLPAECYGLPGRFAITIFLTSNSQKTALYAGIGTVSRTSSGTASPGTTQTVVDLINAINAAIAQIPATDTAIKAAMAPTYSTSGLYAVGAYAWYDGTLYRCTTAITSGETWNSAHWAAAAIGNDVCDLRSALKQIIPALPNDLKIIITDETIVIPAYTRMYYGKNYIYRTPSNITINRVATSSSTISEEYVVFDSTNESFACSAGAQAALGENKYLLCTLSKGGNGCSLSPDFVLWDGGYRYETSLHADIVPPNNGKINITDSTITIPAYTRLYYRGTLIYRFGVTDTTIQRVATQESGYSEERLIFNSKTESAFCLGGNSTAVDFGNMYIICTLSKSLNGCSLSPNFVDWNNQSKYEQIKQAHIVLPLSNKINITETTITIPAYTRMYYGRNYIFRNTEDVVITRAGTNEERLIFNYNTQLFSCREGVNGDLAPNEYYVFGLSKGLNGCTLSPNFVLWNGSEIFPHTKNLIIDINNRTEITDLLNNATIVRRSDNYTDPFTPIDEREDLFALIHISDIHGDGNAVRRLIQFFNFYSDYAFDMIHTGDAVIQYFGDYTPFLNTSIAGAEDVLQVIGNHECWIEGDTWPHPYNATEEQVYTEYFAPNISRWGVTSPGVNKCYYYKDYSVAKLRMIVLDCIHYDETQAAWFAYALSSAKTAGLRVVAVSHYHAQSGNTGYDTGFNTYGYVIAPVETPPIGTQIERLEDSAYDLVDDFITDGGEFVCWLTGHEHTDSIGIINNHPNQIEIIISTGKCADSLGYRSRAYNTKAQDLFNFFFVDGVSKLIKLVRVGATEDKYMRSSKAVCINYQTKTLIGTI